MSRTRLVLVVLLVIPAMGAAPPARVSDTDWELYGARLRSAHRAWQLGKVEDAWRELEACRWDLRGWEHRHLCALLMRKQAILSRIWCSPRVVFTPDGHLLTSLGPRSIGVRDGRTFAVIDRGEIESESEGEEGANVHFATGAVEHLVASAAGTSVRVHRGG